MTNIQKELAECVPIGKTEAISAEELSKLFETERRELRHMIENARRAGLLIIGDDKGYYFPASDDEIKAYIHRVQCRIRTACVCLAPFLRQIREAERSGG